MNASRPPRLTETLLQVLLRGQEPLLGDLIEELRTGRSHVWVWRQALGALLFAVPRTRRSPAPLALGIGGDSADHADRHLRTESSRPTRRVNLTASPVHGVGGLGLVALGGLVSAVRPEAWTFALYGPIGGLLIAGAIILARRASVGENQHLTSIHPAPNTNG